MQNIRNTQDTRYNLSPTDESMIENMHRDLHASLSHYVNSANTKWDILVPFYLNSHRATLHSTITFSPFFLLHGREMIQLSHENLKSRVTGENLDHKRRLENMKTSFRTANKTFSKANRISHQNNKKLYGRKTKTRKFEVEDLVYLYNPTMKLCRSRIFLGSGQAPLM